MALEVLQQIAEQLADLPERLAAVLGEGKDGDLSSLMADAEALASLEVDSGLPQPVTVVNWPDWLKNPPIQQAEPSHTERDSQSLLPATQQMGALAEEGTIPLAAPPVAWLEEAETPVAAPAPDTAIDADTQVAPLLAGSGGASAVPDSRPHTSMEGLFDYQFNQLPDTAPGLSGRGSAFDEEEAPIGSSDTGAEFEFDRLPPATGTDSGDDTGLEHPPPAAGTTQSAAFDDTPPVGAPAPETPGAGGTDWTKMVTLLERIATAVESMQRGNASGAAAPDPGGSGGRRGSSRMAAWTEQHARDFDAEEGFPNASPSVNVSSVAGLSGASSIDRGFGSGYRKRTSATSGGQRQRQTSPADAKVFNEPGGH